MIMSGRKILHLLGIISFVFAVSSCSHNTSTQRDVASTNCWETIRPEYQSYFDSVEKCIEKQPK